jgi:hypothetical protein
MKPFLFILYDNTVRPVRHFGWGTRVLLGGGRVSSRRIMQLNLIARVRGDVDLIYVAQGGLFYVGSIGFSSKVKIRYRCVSL